MSLIESVAKYVMDDATAESHGQPLPDYRKASISRWAKKVFEENANDLIREEAKKITKALRSKGIHAGIVYCNGTSVPPNSDKYEASIEVDAPNSEGKWYYGGLDPMIGMSYTINDEPDRALFARNLVKTLEELGISYYWDGDPFNRIYFLVDLYHGGLARFPYSRIGK